MGKSGLRLRVRLERIRNSPPARAWEMLREAPGVRGLVARRTAGYEAALRSALDSLRSMDEHMRGDAVFLASWSEYLFGVWQKFAAGSGEAQGARGTETAGSGTAPPAAP